MVPKPPKKLLSPFIATCPKCERRVGVLTAKVQAWCQCNGSALRPVTMKLTQRTE